MANFIRCREISSQQRLDDDVALQAAFVHLVKCGPATVGLAVAAMLDACNAPPDALDLLKAWKTVAPSTCPWEFNSPAPKRRPPVHLHLVPPVKPKP
jgi:hypothetical protein